jgi:membrane associated rhomboid family serine protease
MGFFLLISFLLDIIITLFLSSLFIPTPFSDTGTVRYRTIPWMTFALILVNSLIFIVLQAPPLYQGMQAIQAEGLDGEGVAMVDRYLEQLYHYGLRVSTIRGPASIGAFTTFTSIFMHGDFWHLLGNMIFLWTFGRRVEDACGGGRFLVFYLVAGLVANLGTLLLNPSMDDRPGIGARGAIAGVMGAYLVLFPGAHVIAFWGLGSLFRVPVMVFLRLLGQVSPIARWIIGGLIGAGIGYGGGSLFVSILTLEIFGEAAVMPLLENFQLVILAGVVLGAVMFGYALGQPVEKDAPIWRWTVNIPAYGFLIFFLIRETVPSINVIQGTQELVGVNNLAHLTGFLAALAIFFFVRKDLFTRYFSGRTV